MRYLGRGACYGAADEEARAQPAGSGKEPKRLAEDCLRARLLSSTAQRAAAASRSCSQQPPAEEIQCGLCRRCLSAPSHLMPRLFSCRRCQDRGDRAAQPRHRANRVAVHDVLLVLLRLYLLLHAGSQKAEALLQLRRGAEKQRGSTQHRASCKLSQGLRCRGHSEEVRSARGSAPVRATSNSGKRRPAENTSL